MEEIEQIIISKSFNRNCSHPYVIDDSHARELAKAIEQYVIKAKIEELTRFVQSNPKLQTTLETIGERIAQLKKGVENGSKHSN